MKLSLFVFGLFTTMVQAQVSPMSVMIHSEDPDLHPANACDGESGFLEEELAIVVGHRISDVDGSTGGRKLESSFCAQFCSYFPSRAWCWAYTPMCAQEGGGYRRALEKEQIISDQSLQCAKTVLVIEEGLKELADFAITDSCRAALLDKKEYECFRVEIE